MDFARAFASDSGFPGLGPLANLSPILAPMVTVVVVVGVLLAKSYAAVLTKWFKPIAETTNFSLASTYAALVSVSFLTESFMTASLVLVAVIAMWVFLRYRGTTLLRNSPTFSLIPIALFALAYPVETQWYESAPRQQMYVVLAFESAGYEDEREVLVNSWKQFRTTLEAAFRDFWIVEVHPAVLDDAVFEELSLRARGRSEVIDYLNRVSSGEKLILRTRVDIFETSDSKGIVLTPAVHQVQDDDLVALRELGGYKGTLDDVEFLALRASVSLHSWLREQGRLLSLPEEERRFEQNLFAELDTFLGLRGLGDMIDDPPSSGSDRWTLPDITALLDSYDRLLAPTLETGDDLAVRRRAYLRKLSSNK